MMEQQSQISNYIPAMARTAIRSGPVNFPNHDWNFATGINPPPLSLGSRLQRRISIPVRQATLNSSVRDSPARSRSITEIPEIPPPAYRDAVPGARFVSIVRDSQRWRRAGIAILLSRLRDLFIARLVLRFIIIFGDYLLGTQTAWLSASKLTFFWITNAIMGRFLGKFSSFGALCSLGWIDGGWWKGTGIDIACFMGFTYAGGVVDGRFLSAEEAAEFEQLMLLESFWKDFWQNLITPSVNRPGT